MGYTNFSADKIQEIIDRISPKRVVDLGSQSLFNQPLLPAPYASTWYHSLGIEYVSIDINGENGSLPLNLTKQIDASKLPSLGEFDMVVDAGTTDHLEVDGKFSWEGYYNGWRNKHSLLRIGGIMYSENPMTGNWPGHGYNYQTEEFYFELVQFAGYQILDLGIHAACHNTTDGWNVYCTLLKESEEFPTLDQFKTFSVKQS